MLITSFKNIIQRKSKARLTLASIICSTMVGILLFTMLQSSLAIINKELSDLNNNIILQVSPVPSHEKKQIQEMPKTSAVLNALKNSFFSHSQYTHTINTQKNIFFF